MNSFTNSLRKIANGLLLTPDRLERFLVLILAILYVEKIRAVFGFSTPLARGLCELAVKQELFREGVEVRCPDEIAAAYADHVEDLPVTVSCREKADGNLIERAYKTNRLRLSHFDVYQPERSV